MKGVSWHTSIVHRHAIYPPKPVELIVYRRPSKETSPPGNLAQTPSSFPSIPIPRSLVKPIPVRSRSSFVEKISGYAQTKVKQSVNLSLLLQWVKAMSTHPPA